MKFAWLIHARYMHLYVQQPLQYLCWSIRTILSNQVFPFFFPELAYSHFLLLASVILNKEGSIDKMCGELRQQVEQLQQEIKHILTRQDGMTAQINNLISVVNQLSIQIQQNVVAVQRLQGLVMTQQSNQQTTMLPLAGSPQVSPFSYQSMLQDQPQLQTQLQPNYSMSLTQSTLTPGIPNYLLTNSGNITNNNPSNHSQYMYVPTVQQPNKNTSTAFNNLEQYNQPGQQLAKDFQGFDGVSTLLESRHKGVKRMRSFPQLVDQGNIIKADTQQRKTVHGEYVALASLASENTTGITAPKQQISKNSNMVNMDQGNIIAGGTAMRSSSADVTMVSMNQGQSVAQQEGMYDDVIAQLWPGMAYQGAGNTQQEDLTRSLSSRDSDGPGNDSCLNQQGVGSVGGAPVRKSSQGFVRLDGMKYHCGKDLTYAVIKRYFDRSLKQAAADLGVCPTTLKRACRRIGIHRWPARQVRKVYKTISEYSHMPEHEKQKLLDQLDEQVKSHLLVHGQLGCGVRLVEDSFVEDSGLGEAAQLGEEGTVSGGKALQKLELSALETLEHTNWVSNQLNDLLQNGLTESIQDFKQCQHTNYQSPTQMDTSSLFQQQQEGNTFIAQS
eukprot:TRINITY_DN8787_c0_g1_i4.p1 TRINITY_DN8787_c0_g1~~TRINITY_DN8787_c0_g1_i4.p1  ORF type:complete len:662 (-),score=55.73 TRINITY_DN8787_c0_g1_i4:1156-2991(-)